MADTTNKPLTDVTRIILRPIASGVPLGFFSFSLGMFMLGMTSIGVIPINEVSQVGLILALFVFPLELLATIFAFMARDSMSAATLGLFTTSWLLLGTSYIISGSTTSIALGCYLFGFAGIVLLLALMAITTKPYFTVLLLLAFTRMLFSGIYEVGGNHAFYTVSGYVALVLTSIAIYGGVAFTLEDAKQNQVLPLFRRGSAADAFNGFQDQLNRVEAEPGVRPQL
jgi:uncharacterized protein